MHVHRVLIKTIVERVKYVHMIGLLVRLIVIMQFLVEVVKKGKSQTQVIQLVYHVDRITTEMKAKLLANHVLQIYHSVTEEATLIVVLQHIVVKETIIMSLMKCVQVVLKGGIRIQTMLLSAQYVREVKQLME